MTHHVQLPCLPPGFQIPDDLKTRLRYDAAAQRLSFEGFMSKATFDRLEQLHTDPAYRRALEQLFQQSVFEGATPQPKSSVRAAVIGLTLLAVTSLAVALVAVF